MSGWCTPLKHIYISIAGCAREVVLVKASERR